MHLHAIGRPVIVTVVFPIGDAVTVKPSLHPEFPAAPTEQASACLDLRSSNNHVEPPPSPVIAKRQLLVQTMNREGSVRHNVDGILAHVPWSEDPTAYAQLFRSGILEVVRVWGGGQSGKNLPSLAFEEDVFEIARHSLPLLEVIQVDPPVVILLSLAGMKGWKMGISDPYGWHDDHLGFDRDPILLPELLVDSFRPHDFRQVAKPLMDAAWQAADFPRSLYYSESGIWVGRQ